MLILTQDAISGPVHIMVNGVEVEVNILGVHGRQVRVGYSAPKDVTILRDSVYWREKDGRS